MKTKVDKKFREKDGKDRQCAQTQRQIEERDSSACETKTERSGNNLLRKTETINYTKDNKRAGHEGCE